MAMVNIYAVLVAGLSAFMLGGAWYSPALFGAAWCREAGIDSQDGGHAPTVYLWALLLSVLAAFVFAMFLGPAPAFGFATGAGFAAGLCWVAASFGINYLFAGRSLKLFLIDGGYHTLQFTLYGAILGLWH